MGPKQESSAGRPPVTQVRFHYIKSNFYRVVHVDGAYGGVAPNGDIHCSVFSERLAIPQVTEHSITQTGMLAEQQVLEGKAGLIRELETDLVLSLNSASELRDWLTGKIEEYKASLIAKQKNE